MSGPEPLPPAVLSRKAVVYVRQSTQAQVLAHGESRRRQYELVDVARSRGFRDVEVIDDDLGRSASGTVDRPGFERLVAWLCAGEVGAVGAEALFPLSAKVGGTKKARNCWVCPVCPLVSLNPLGEACA